MKTDSKVILLPGSRRSGGFALTSDSLLKNSRLMVILDENPLIAKFQLPQVETMTTARKPCCWVMLDSNGCINVPLRTLKEYRVKAGDLSLTVRGSRLELSFMIRGPLITEAKRHSSLPLFR